jgi:hypothetical protein
LPAKYKSGLIKISATEEVRDRLLNKITNEKTCRKLVKLLEGWSSHKIILRQERQYYMSLEVCAAEFCRQRPDFLVDLAENIWRVLATLVEVQQLLKRRSENFKRVSSP